ncbi:hypothetical protein ACFSC6_10030 [Rufibacter sediminis]|uniref:Uncharacterized protein n=1 Tax=Rufibacter sediminis TaxID=2762756 RepID=A0ABR6VX76_9BACT|nr:hypothetical protein [Rufibacter sediminis]MBC3541772.1 hypothetical protein [Rufibacter sediminis]
MRKSKNRLDLGSLSKEDYFDRVNYVRTVAGLRNALTAPKQTLVNTSKTVTFRGLAFGASLKEAKRLLGKPEFKVSQDQNVEGHEVLFYFSSIGSAKVTHCLHFLYGKFILGQSIVKTPKPARCKAIVESVLNSYNLLPATQETLALESAFPVCDASRNRIEMHYAFDLAFTYATGDPEVLPLVTKVQMLEKSRNTFWRGNFQEQVRYV